MEKIAPAGPIYQAGTLSGNPLAMTAGYETLSRLDQDSYAYFRKLGDQLEAGFREAASKYNIPHTVVKELVTRYRGKRKRPSVILRRKSTVQQVATVAIVPVCRNLSKQIRLLFLRRVSHAAIEIWIGVLIAIVV